MAGAIAVYNGRDNTIDIALTKNNVPISASFATGAAVAVYTKRQGTLVRIVNGKEAGSADRSSFDFSQDQVVPGAGPNPLRIIKLLLGRLDGTPTRLTVGTNYYAELMVYSTAQPQGVVWASFYLDVFPENMVA